MKALKQLRNNYNSIKQALPWLDSAVYEDDKADFPEYINNNLPEKIEFPDNIVRFLHTEVDFPEIEKFATENPKKNIIIESGDRKLIYHYEKVLHALQNYSNIYLCTYNFCNWLGHEQLVELGLADRLLYGSHSPKYSADVSMSPIILGDFPWKIKCDIAGNNLRRLLGIKEITVPEVALNLPEPFIIDAHTP